MASCVKSAAGGWIETGFLKEGKSRRNLGIFRSPAASLREQYRTLKIQPGASEKDVKKAFRELALQYHPDVCKGSNCGVQFHKINEAYDLVMSSLRASEEDDAHSMDGSRHDYAEDFDGPMRGMYDSSYDMWEEWMGWEGGGIRDYSSHINPYI